MFLLLAQVTPLREVGVVLWYPYSSPEPPYPYLCGSHMQWPLPDVPRLLDEFVLCRAPLTGASMSLVRCDERRQTDERTRKRDAGESATVSLSVRGPDVVVSSNAATIADSEHNYPSRLKGADQ